MVDHQRDRGRLWKPAAVAIAAAIVDYFVIAHAAARAWHLASEDAIRLLLPVKWHDVGEVLADPAVSTLIPVERNIRARWVVTAAELCTVSNLVLSCMATAAAFAAAVAEIRESNGQAANANRTGTSRYNHQRSCSCSEG